MQCPNCATEIPASEALSKKFMICPSCQSQLRATGTMWFVVVPTILVGIFPFWLSNINSATLLLLLSLFLLGVYWISFKFFVRLRKVNVDSK
jgi:hypothetical protein